MKLFYRANPNGSVRVWRSDWFGDQFDTVTAARFALLQQSDNLVRDQFGIFDNDPIELIEAEDEES